MAMVTYVFASSTAFSIGFPNARAHHGTGICEFEDGLCGCKRSIKNKEHPISRIRIIVSPGEFLQHTNTLVSRIRLNMPSGGTNRLQECRVMTDA